MMDKISELSLSTYAADDDELGGVMEFHYEIPGFTTADYEKLHAQLLADQDLMKGNFPSHYENTFAIRQHSVIFAAHFKDDVSTPPKHIRYKDYQLELVTVGCAVGVDKLSGKVVFEEYLPLSEPDEEAESITSPELLIELPLSISSSIDKKLRKYGGSAPQCKGKTKRSSQCKNRTLIGDLCWRHRHSSTIANTDFKH